MISRPETSAMPNGWTDELETPPWLFSQLNAIFHFTLDAAACATNTRCKRWLEDALTSDWAKVADGGPVFLNPPYSNTAPFLQKAIETQEQKVATVALLKLDPSVKWWALTETATIVPFRRRVRFYYQGKPAPYAASFPSCLAVYWNIFDDDGLLPRGFL